MAYIVDVENQADPIDTRGAGQAAEEIRAIKTKLKIYNIAPNGDVTFNRNIFTTGNTTLGAGVGNIHLVNGVATVTNGLAVNQGSGAVGSASTLGGQTLELGVVLPGDLATFIDFHARAGSDFDARIVREQAINGIFQIQQLGSGGVEIAAPSGSFDLLALNARVLANSGYQKLPGGIIIQWTQGQRGTGSWPIAFPNACLQAVATFDSVSNGGATNTHQGVSFTSTTFTLSAGADNNNIQHIIAIGF